MIRIAFDWWSKGSRLLREEGAEVAIVNGVIPLRFRPKMAVNHGVTLKANKFYLMLFAKELYRKCDKIVCVRY